MLSSCAFLFQFLIADRFKARSSHPRPTSLPLAKPQGLPKPQVYSPNLLKTPETPQEPKLDELSEQLLALPQFEEKPFSMADHRFPAELWVEIFTHMERLPLAVLPNVSFVNHAFHDRFRPIRHRWIATSTPIHFRLDYLHGNGKDEVAAMIKALKDKKVLEAPMKKGIKKFEKKIDELAVILISAPLSFEDGVKFLDDYVPKVCAVALRRIGRDTSLASRFFGAGRFLGSYACDNVFEFQEEFHDRVNKCVQNSSADSQELLQELAKTPEYLSMKQMAILTASISSDFLKPLQGDFMEIISTPSIIFRHFYEFGKTKKILELSKVMEITDYVRALSCSVETELSANPILNPRTDKERAELSSKNQALSQPGDEAERRKQAEQLMRRVVATRRL